MCSNKQVFLTSRKTIFNFLKEEKKKTTHKILSLLPNMCLSNSIILKNHKWFNLDFSWVYAVVLKLLLFKRTSLRKIWEYLRLGKLTEYNDAYMNCCKVRKEKNNFTFLCFNSGFRTHFYLDNLTAAENELQKISIETLWSQNFYKFLCLI